MNCYLVLRRERELSISAVYDQQLVAAGNDEIHRVMIVELTQRE